MSDPFVSRRYLSALRILLGLIFLATFGSNLAQGFYTPEGLRGFILGLAEGHPLGLYAAFLRGAVAPAAAFFAPFQMIAELALLAGLLTPPAAIGAAFFFANLLLAYTNPTLGEWLWTYVLLLALAPVVGLRRGRPPAAALWPPALAGLLGGAL